jgi:DNA-binding response OmpR family regulator
VEDEPLVAMEFSQTLSEAGFVVIGPAESVARALALLAQFGCDAAVLDINLGTETSEPVARELIKLGVPFTTISGYSREQLPANMRTAPLLGKPVSPAMLIAGVTRCLGRE